jgi:acetyl/propionyl-CoA carboxylase alpha subunit
LGDRKLHRKKCYDNHNKRQVEPGLSAEACDMQAVNVVATLLFAPLLVSLSVSCRRDQAPRSELVAVPVRLQTIEAKPHVAAEEVVGTIRPKHRSVIEAKISGLIEKMLVLPGQEMKAGELLVQLDAREAKAKLDQAIAVRQQTENDLKRYEVLRAKQVVTPADFETAQSKAQIAVAAAAEAETNLAYATITAPFDGVITPFQAKLCSKSRTRACYNLRQRCPKQSSITSNLARDFRSTLFRMNLREPLARSRHRPM